MGVLQSVGSGARLVLATPAIHINLALPDGHKKLRLSEEASYVTQLLKCQHEAHASGNRTLSQNISAEIKSKSVLQAVSPAFRNARLFRQIVDHEKVHRLKNVQELREKRLSREYCDKDCQAIIVQTQNGRFILANIFRIHVSAPVTEGVIEPWDFPGLVDDIKSKRPQVLEDGGNLTGYYSISSVLPGAGKSLIEDLSQITAERRPEVTISPIRGFTEKYNREELLALPDGKIREKVLDYLSNLNDPVQKFHMGNGAYVGWIHVNREAPPQSQDWITVNYVYNRSKLSMVQNAFKAKKDPHIVISSGLANNSGSYSPFIYSVFDIPVKPVQAALAQT